MLVVWEMLASTWMQDLELFVIRVLMRVERQKQELSWVGIGVGLNTFAFAVQTWSGILVVCVLVTVGRVIE